jgi:quercetin dioxygenase-like cupin family protein
VSAPTTSAGTIDWAAVPEVAVAAGITGRTVAAEHLSTTLFELQPGARIPRHAHPSDELGVVLRGGLHLVLGASAVVVGPGESFFVPGDTPHEGNALDDGCTLLECYAPPRVPAPSDEQVPA